MRFSRIRAECVKMEKFSRPLSECGMRGAIQFVGEMPSKNSSKAKRAKYLLIGAARIATSAAVLAWIQSALLHIVGARSALETFRTMTFEVATGQ